MLKRALVESADQETAFAWRVFLGDAFTNDPLVIRDKRPGLTIVNNKFYLSIFKKYHF